jgi:hydrogenase nickel incorporation protein HypA/HybF
MHELAITQSLFDIVLKQAEKEKAKKVESITLVIGEMTGVVIDSVQFYIDLMSKNTIAEGAKVIFKSVPVKVKCRGCGKISELKPFDYECPFCKATSLEVISGKELLVESIEVT